MKLGTPSPNPWDLSLCGQNGSAAAGQDVQAQRLFGAADAAPPFRPWLGARVASLRGPILRPGADRIAPADCDPATKNVAGAATGRV
jgi:hypothetical protein